MIRLEGQPRWAKAKATLSAEGEPEVPTKDRQHGAKRVGQRWQPHRNRAFSRSVSIEAYPTAVT